MNPHTNRIITWQPVLTDHQAYTYEEMQRQSGMPVIAMVTKLEDETRRAQGWSDTKVNNLQRCLIPNRGFFFKGISTLIKNRDQVHIFGSAFGDPRLILLLWFSTMLRIECYLVSEPYSPVSFGYFTDRIFLFDRIKNFLRPYVYKGYGLLLKGRLSGVFTISDLAFSQYKKAGISEKKLFPFGYFIPAVTGGDNYEISQSKRFRIVFVGSLIPRKGLSVLIEAVLLAIEKGVDFQLDVYGPGDPSGFAFDDDRIFYKGLIPFGDTQIYLRGYDLFVLPSHYDGWGVVINEAIYSDVPVVCSDQVGARTLVETFGVGMVSKCGDVQELADVLIELQADPLKMRAMKLECSTASKIIQPKIAAAYMLEVLFSDSIERSEIASPWYRK